MATDPYRDRGHEGPLDKDETNESKEHRGPYYNVAVTDDSSRKLTRVSTQEGFVIGHATKTRTKGNGWGEFPFTVVSLYQPFPRAMIKGELIPYTTSKGIYVGRWRGTVTQTSVALPKGWVGKTSNLPQTRTRPRQMGIDPQFPEG